jgi:hypothetical protein
MYKRVGNKVLYISPLAEAQAVEVATEKKVKTKRKKK